MVYLETLSCSLSLAFLAEVAGRGYQREGFSRFLRAITVTERAIARSVDCECPISVRAIALRLGNSLPYTDTSRLVPRPFFTLDPYDWERVLITQYGSTVYIACRASGSRYALGPYNTVDPLKSTYFSSLTSFSFLGDVFYASCRFSAFSLPPSASYRRKHETAELPYFDTPRCTIIERTTYNGVVYGNFDKKNLDIATNLNNNKLLLV